MRRTSDGGFIMPGWKYTSKSKYDASLVKIDAHGDVEWQKTYGMGGKAALIAVQEVPGNGYIATGDNCPDPSNPEDRDLWVVKVIQTGLSNGRRNTVAAVLKKAAPSCRQRRGDTCVVTRIPSVHMASGSSSLTRPEHSVAKGFGGWGVEIRSALQTPDSGFMFTAMNRSFGAGEYDAWVVKLDNDGNTEWQKAYGGPQNDYGSLST